LYEDFMRKTGTSNDHAKRVYSATRPAHTFFQFVRFQNNAPGRSEWVNKVHYGLVHKRGVRPHPTLKDCLLVTVFKARRGRFGWATEPVEPDHLFPNNRDAPELDFGMDQPHPDPLMLMRTNPNMVEIEVLLLPGYEWHVQQYENFSSVDGYETYYENSYERYMYRTYPSHYYKMDEFYCSAYWQDE